MAWRSLWTYRAASVVLLLIGGGVQAQAAGAPDYSPARLAAAERKAAAALNLGGMALNNHQLTRIRGGFNPAPGVTVNFGFQQTTFADHRLIQSTIIPNTTIAISPGNTAVAATAIAATAVAVTRLPANQTPVTVISEAGAGGVTNLFRNTANGQFIQQVTAINIGITGLNQMMARQNQVLTLANRLAPGR